MTSDERWERVSAAIDAVLDAEPVKRARYVTEVCAGDAALLAEVESILDRGQSPSFLDSGAIAFAAPVLERAEPNDLASVRGLPYELERRLARGGMATVYLARDVKHDRRVAMKVLHSDLTLHVEGERFVQEIRLTARLQHPHVLGLLDSGVLPPEAGPFAGRPYYVMPFVEGESLRTRLASGRPLARREALRLLREVADALSYAHEQGVIHRDIKPENILISGGHAVVGDFGIAKALVASQAREFESHAPTDSTSAMLTDLSTLLGTPAYMAPEQAAAKWQVDHRADLYAWGVVAYELLAGRHPFEGRSSAREFVAAHATEAPRALRETAPGVPIEVATLVMRCLAKNPAHRPNSAEELVAALDEPVIQSESKTLGTTAPRGRVVAIGASAVVLVLGATATIASLRSGASGTGVVAGTGDPAIDVRAFQKAVDDRDTVVVKGHLSFDARPSKAVAPRLASGWFGPAAEVLISRTVTIVGERDANGVMATIEGGTIPFYVDAPGASVRIRGIRFMRPKSGAVLVHAVSGLELTNSRIEGLVPSPRWAVGIAISTSGEVPKPGSPGDPENVAGHLLVTENDIDAVGGSPLHRTAGIMVGGVGQSPNREVELDIIGNNIRNTSESAINIRRVEGRVRVLGNTIHTGPDEPGDDPAAIRLVNRGPFLMANNSIECGWPNAMCLAVFSQFEEWPIDSAIVRDNDILMSPPPGATLGESNAAITVKGFARNVIVRHNTIRGRARTGLMMSAFRGGVPEYGAFIDNRFDSFKSTLADIFIGNGVLKRRIVGPGTVLDQGAGATLER